VIVRVDLTTNEDDTNLVKTVLKALDLQFSDSVVKVDTGVFNLSRLCRLAGTINRKGHDRQLHRLARILIAAAPNRGDAPPVATPKQLLVALARTVPEPPLAPKPQTGAGYFEHFDLAGYIANYFPDAAGPFDYEGGLKWLMPCPFTEHESEPGRRTGFIIEHASGGRSAGCMRDRCRSAGYGWKELRERYPKPKKVVHLHAIRGTGGREKSQSQPAPDRSETNIAPDEQFSLDARSQEDRPIVNYVAGLDLKTNSAAAWKHLIDRNKPPTLYGHGDLIARIDRDRETGAAYIKECGRYELAHRLAEVARWLGPKGLKNAQWTAPPSTLVHNMLATPDKPLPSLYRLTRVPVFTPEGRLISFPGYDKASGIYDDRPPGLKIGSISDVPTDAELSEARDLLLTPLVDFPFVIRAADCATCLALMIERFARDLIHGCLPIYVFDAAKRGTGKGRCARVCLYPALGELTTRPPVNDEESAAKRLLAVLRNGSELYLIDNQTRLLDSESLASAITTPYDGFYSDRILGITGMGTYRVRFTTVVTANNARLSPDLWRRAPAHVRMVAKEERPEDRDEFKLDLDEWLPANRGKMIWAICTLIQHWIAEGMPPWTGKKIGSFEQWCRVIGGILTAAGVEGFLAGFKERANASDERTSDEREFVIGWWKQHGTGVVTARDLLPLAIPIDRFNLVRQAVPGDEELTRQKQATALGRWLAANVEGVFADYQITLDSRAHGFKRYKLKAI